MITTTGSVVGGEKPNRRKFKLKLGGNVMAMRGKKKKKRGNRR